VSEGPKISGANKNWNLENDLPEDTKKGEKKAKVGKG